MPSLLRTGLVALALAGAACAAPERLAYHRYPGVHVPAAPLTPEARPGSVPLEMSTGQAPLPTQVTGLELARTAQSFVGKQHLVWGGKRFPDDCTGLARAVYAAHGIDLMADSGKPGDNGVTAIWRFTSRHGRLLDRDPAPGDLVFFRETYDRNRDGRMNDGLTHIGVVEGTDPDGTVIVIHRVAPGVVRYHMNLAHPHQVRESGTGRIINDYLRESGQLRTAAELFAGYGRLAR